MALSEAGAAYVLLDVLSLILASTVSLFFWRSHRAVPTGGFAMPAVAFGILAASYLTIAATEFVIEHPVLEAVRSGGQLLGAILLLADRVTRHTWATPGTKRLVAASAGVVIAAYIAMYWLVPPRAALPDPESYMGVVEFAEFLILTTTAGLVALDVRPGTLRDARVPIALLFLGLAKYSWSLLGIGGAGAVTFAAATLPYGWRIFGLAILLTVVLPTRRFLLAKA